MAVLRQAMSARLRLLAFRGHDARTCSLLRDPGARLEQLLANSWELTAQIVIWAVKVIGQRRVGRYLSASEWRAVRVEIDG